MRAYDEEVMAETQENNLPVPSQEGTMEQNPFDAERFRNVQLPDQPLQYGGGLIENLLNNDEVPEEIRKKHWHIFHKDNVLTFLDEPRKQNKLLNFDIIKIDILNAMPYYDYTFKQEMEFDILRNIFETKLDRAMGNKGKNERILLNSQFTESKMVSESGSGDMVKEGFFKRLLGRR